MRRHVSEGSAVAIAAGIVTVVAMAFASHSSAQPAGQRFAEQCAALATAQADGITRAVLLPRGPFTPSSGMNLFAPSTLLPTHCDISGVLGARKGVGGQDYAIRYHLRLPENWNGRFFFQGGGGLNGQVGDALGLIAFGQEPALARGYAVVSQDSGHDSVRNSIPAMGGEAAFGADPQARAEYGGVSLKRVADAAKAAMQRLYGKKPQFSYFVGCSKGGQEGMAVAQRYPDAFDGVVAAAPGFSLPRAALAEAWDVQAFAALIPRNADGRRPYQGLADTFSNGDFKLVQHAVLNACDAADGLADGIVGRFAQCTSGKVLAQLRRATCRGGKKDSCLSKDQISALKRLMGGPRDSQGKALYASWAWDGGIGSEAWRSWKTGNARMPALNVVLGGPALATVFGVPPVPLGPDPQGIMDWQLGFNFDRDAKRIYATDATFPRSAWQDISARSPDLAAFRDRGGKMIVPHGVSDPVFSIHDTLAWYGEVQSRQGKRGTAANFVRVFPVPGMAHCAGGPATDTFDAFAALTAWVEKGQAPANIVATAGPASPWPGRSRPLCPYPRVATYSGKGSIEDAKNFHCQ